MKKSIFEYGSYKDYLKEWMLERENGGKGMKSALGRAIQCQPAYISQVLLGSANFSLEQAEVLNRFLNHSEEEADFFYLLVQRERAGSANLQNYFSSAIEKIKSNRLILKERLQVSEGMTELDRARYYSSWQYTAVHILLTIPGFQDRASIAGRLGIDVQRAAEILDFLVNSGLAEQVGDVYRVTNARIHLGNHTPEILKHHSNWRMRAVWSLEKETVEELHYSSVVSLSRDDILHIREYLMKAIEEVKQKVRPSKEEELYSFCLDWFRV